MRRHRYRIPGRSSHPPSAFTLIELLIVVAIIAILAAIAVPNFLEAQVRAKVSRVKSDMRTLSTAIESYRIDHTDYPPNGTPGDPQGMVFNIALMLVPLSTPVAYLSSAHLYDPFNHTPAPNNPRALLSYFHIGADEWLVKTMYPLAFPGHPEKIDRVTEHCFYFQSVGPDGSGIYDQLVASGIPAGAPAYIASIKKFAEGDFIYDPTNGTVSLGEISRTAKGFMTSPLVQPGP